MTNRVKKLNTLFFEHAYRKYLEFCGTFGLETSIGKYNVKIIKQPYQVIDVPLNLIKFKLPKMSHHYKILSDSPRLFGIKLKPIGLIQDGNWDIHQRKISDYAYFKALRKKYIQGCKWTETIYYERHLNYLDKKIMESEIFNVDNTVRKYGTFTEFVKNRGYYLDNLYNDLKNQPNIRSSSELGFKIENNINVAVTRNGRIVKAAGEGHHRLVMAKLINIPKVPVIVTMWHKNYIDNVKTITNTKPPCTESTGV